MCLEFEINWVSIFRSFKHDLHLLNKKLDEYQNDYDSLNKKNNETKKVLIERQKAIVALENSVFDLNANIADTERNKPNITEQSVMVQKSQQVLKEDCSFIDSIHRNKKFSLKIKFLLH